MVDEPGECWTLVRESVRELKALTGGFLRKKLISEHGLVSSYERQ